MSALRWRVTAAATLAVVLAGVGALWLFAQDPDRYRDEIAATLGAVAGQPVEMGGALRLRWRPSPSLTAEQVRVRVAGATVTMGSVQMIVEPQALLARRLRARRVVVDDLRIDLEAAAGPVAAPAVMPDLAQLGAAELDVRGVKVSRAGVALFTLDGVLVREAGSSAGARVEVTAHVEARAIRAVARLRTAPARIDLDALEVHLPAGVVTGGVSLHLDGARPRLTGELGADALVLGPGGPAAGGRLIPVVPLDLAALATLDAALRVRVGRLSLGDFMIGELSAPVTLNAGRVDVKAAGVLAGGPLRAALGAAAGEGFTLDVELREADAGTALVMTGITTAERGGRLGLEASLHGAGADTAALVAGLDGRIAVALTGVTVRGGAAMFAGPDVLSGVMRALQRRDSERVTLECAVARFAVRAGDLVSEHTIGARSRTMNLLGSGRVSLGREEVELALRPWPRDGLGLSAAGWIGAVAITGPLADPDVVLTGEAELRAGATPFPPALAAFTTALLERARGDAPCRQAGGPLAATRAPGTAAADIDGALRSVGAAIHDLFGTAAAARRDRVGR